MQDANASPGGDIINLPLFAFPIQLDGLTVRSDVGAAPIPGSALPRGRRSYLNPRPEPCGAIAYRVRERRADLGLRGP